MLARIDLPDPAIANARPCDDLENGATGLSLAFAGSIGAYGFGLAAGTTRSRACCDDIHLDAGIALDLDVVAAAVAAASTPRWQSARHRPRRANVRFGFDPHRRHRRRRRGAAMVEDGAAFRAATRVRWRGEGFDGPFAVADGRVIHDAGGSEAQELAFVLAVALAYLRALEAERRAARRGARA